MMKSFGFTLIECILYLCLSSLFTLLVLHSYLMLQKTVIERLTAAYEHVTLAISLDSIIADIASAPIDKKHWSSRGPQLIRWSDEQGNIHSFALSNNNLLKITRAVRENGILKGPAFNVILHNIQGSFEVKVNDNNIESIIIKAIALVGRKKQNINVIMRPKAGIINA